MNGTRKEKLSLNRKIDLIALGAVIGWMVMVYFLWMGIAHGQVAVAASQPSSAPAFDPNNINGLAAWAWYAFQSKQWALLIMGAVVILLAYERHWKGILGEKSSMWLSSKKGVAITTFLTSVATAGMAVAASGWKSIGNACLMAAIVGAINLLAQLPFKKADAAVTPAAAPTPAPADAAAAPDPEKKD